MRNNWLIFTRGEIPFYRLDIFDQVLKLSKRFYGNDFSRLLYINEGENLWWCLNKKALAVIGANVATKVLKKGDLVEVDTNKRVVKIIK